MAPVPFQTIIDEHGRPVRRFLVARVGPVDADDCWQETFIAALRAWPERSEHPHPRAWLLTIAHHKAIDHLRARARQPLPAADVPDPPAGSGPEPAVGLDPIWSEVAALPDKQRTAVALRFLGDLSHAEIGAAMEISEAAARRNVHEGISRLREERGR